MTTTEPTTVTTEEIEQAILDALTEDDQRWSVVRRSLPGTYEAQNAILIDLHERVALTAKQVSGTPYARLATDFDKQTDARHRAWLRSRHPLLGSGPRDFVTV